MSEQSPSGSGEGRPGTARWRRGASGTRRWIALAAAVWSAGSALASQGDLDPTFGTGGVARIPLGASVDSVGGLALQPDGKIVIAASASSFLTLVRLDGLGALDVTFAGGKVHGTDPAPVGVVVEDDGTIRAGGGDRAHRNAYVFLRSFDASGNVGNRVNTPVTDPSIGGLAVALGGAGRVLMLAITDFFEAQFEGPDAFVVAFGSDALDTSFAGNGILSTQAVSADLAQRSGGGLVSVNRAAFAVDQESVVLMADFTSTNPDADSAVLGLKLLRYDSKGQLDGSFGTGGILDASGPGLPDQIVLAPQLYPGGKVITAGTTAFSSPDPERMWVKRTDASGQPDPTFGPAAFPGIVFIDAGHVSVYTASVSVAPDGKIVLTGSSNPNQTGPTFYLVRLRSDGTLDTTFGGSGVVVEPITPFERTPQIVVQPNGDILAFGRAAVSGSDPATFDLAVARYLGSPCGDGQIDAGSGETCDDGALANGTPASCCTATCTYKPPATACSGGTCNAAGVCVAPTAACGNDIVDDGEQCDDGAGNGTPASCCTATCSYEPPATACTGGTCNAAGVCVPSGPAVPPSPAVCGNGILERDEQCDDGNTTDGDCCSATCRIEGASQVCRASSNPCVKDDHCDGNTAKCNIGGFEPPGTTVCTVPDSCTLDDFCDGNGACVPGKRVCSATFEPLRQAAGFAVTCQSKTAATCTIDFTIPGGLTARASRAAAGEPAKRGGCPAALSPGASANSLFRGAGTPLKLPEKGGALPFRRKSTLKLSKDGLRLYRCSELTLDATATISRNDGAQLTVKQQLRLLIKKLHGGK